MKSNHNKVKFAILLLGIFLLSGCIEESIEPEQPDSVIMDDDPRVSELILNSIDETYRCSVDTDCVVHELDCLVGSCWNKDNLPDPPSLPPNAGACPPPPGVSGCVCEKNRCQPNVDERNERTFHLQSCNSNENCFSDESCLDSNTMSWHYQYPLKVIDAEKRVCYTKCEVDNDCPSNMKCSSVKLVSKDLAMSLGNSDWESNPDLQKAEIIQYCAFSNLY